MVVLALTGCGGDGDGGGSQFRYAIEPEAQERAESILLTLSDFPDGWRASPAPERDEEADEAFNDCIGVDYSAFTLIADAHSEEFTMAETASAYSDAWVFQSEQTAMQALEEWAEGLEDDGAGTCIIELLGEPMDENVEVTGAEVDELAFTPPAGVDDANAWQVPITIAGKAGSEAEGFSVTAYIGIVYLRTGDTGAQISTFANDTSFDTELRDKLIVAVAGRMPG